MKIVLPGLLSRTLLFSRGRLGSRLSAPVGAVRQLFCYAGEREMELGRVVRGCESLIPFRVLFPFSARSINISKLVGHE